jgi:hypothetical protein
MDPVSAVGLAASAIQLADVAARVFIALFQYYRRVKEAPATAEALRNELQNLSTIVDAMTRHFDTRDKGDQVATSPLGFLGSSIKETERLLLHMEHRVKEENARNVKRLKWPFTETENKSLVSQIQRYTAHLTLALNIHQT